MTGSLCIWEEWGEVSPSSGISTMTGVPEPSYIIVFPGLTTSSSSSSRSSLSLSSVLMPIPRVPSPSSPAPRKKWAVALSPSLAGNDHIPAGAPTHPALQWRVCIPVSSESKPHSSAWGWGMGNEKIRGNYKGTRGNRKQSYGEKDQQERRHVGYDLR